VSPVADPVTRTYAARVSIDDPDARVLLGMTAKVRFLRRDGNTRLTVPLTAIFNSATAAGAVGGRPIRRSLATGFCRRIPRRHGRAR
jgi:multidrug efflux pump subunit AcrA (membrane-fusion protein)